MLDLPSLAAVVFDVDGTLATSSSAHLDALAAAAGSVLEVDVEFSMRSSSGSSAGTPLMNGLEVAGWVDAQCFRALRGLDPADDLVDELHEEFLSLYAETYLRALMGGASPGSLIDGVGETLVALMRNGVHLGLATGNIASVACSKLLALNIGTAFSYTRNLGFGDVALNRSAVGHRAISAARSRVVPGGPVLLVGDTAADMVSARDNGAIAVGVLTGSADRSQLKAAGADFVLDDVTGVPKLAFRLVEDHLKRQDRRRSGGHGWQVA